MKNTFKSLIFFGAVLFAASPLQAQTYQTSLTGEVQYPDVTMTPTSFNLDKANTKYLSNHSLPGKGPLTGSIMEVAGWSTDNDGGLTYGISTSGTYSGVGAIAIPNARDVQVGLMEGGSDEYIVAAYYDVAISHYCYNLYKWDLALGSCTFLYKFKFRKPNIVLPEYISNTDYCTVFTSTYPPAPDAVSTTMGYDRISLDISKNANRIALIMGDGSDGRMYLTVGNIGLDTIQLCPNLYNTNGAMAICTSIGLPTTAPRDIITYPGTGWTSIGGGAYDYFDSYSGQYVRYYTTGPLAGKYHYSYYPIDEWIYVTEYDGITCTQLASNTNFNPLIGIHATSRVTTPGLNPRYRQRWGDVAFSEILGASPSNQVVQCVFYVDHSTTIGDLYVTADLTFNDLYNFTIAGPSGPWPTYPIEHPTDLQIGCVNTADELSLSSDFGPGGTMHSSAILESDNISLPTSIPIRAKIDCPDDGGYFNWAVTFAYTPTTATFGMLPIFDASDPSRKLYDVTDDGRNNIYVRYPIKHQISVNNGTMANVAGGAAYAADNVFEAKDPAISWNAAGTSFAVAWVSERAGRVNALPFGYLACKVDPYTPTTGATTADASFITMPDYLYVSNAPSLDCGVSPVISLSKHDNGLSDIYTAFAQVDNSSTYSIVHKDNVWTTTSTWRKGSDVADGFISPKVVPNPFTSDLKVIGSGVLHVVLYDVTGRLILSTVGNDTQINSLLKDKVSTLMPGLYTMRIKQLQGNEEIFKLTKL